MTRNDDASAAADVADDLDDSWGEMEIPHVDSYCERMEDLDPDTHQRACMRIMKWLQDDLDEFDTGTQRQAVTDAAIRSLAWVRCNYEDCGERYVQGKAGEVDELQSHYTKTQVQDGITEETTNVGGDSGTLVGFIDEHLDTLTRVHYSDSTGGLQLHWEFTVDGESFEFRTRGSDGDDKQERSPGTLQELIMQKGPRGEFAGGEDIGTDDWTAWISDLLEDSERMEITGALTEAINWLDGRLTERTEFADLADAHRKNGVWRDSGTTTTEDGQAVAWEDIIVPTELVQRACSEFDVNSGELAQEIVTKSLNSRNPDQSSPSWWTSVNGTDAGFWRLDARSWNDPGEFVEDPETASDRVAEYTTQDGLASPPGDSALSSGTGGDGQ